MVYAEQACTESASLDAWLALAERHRAAAADVAVFDGESAIGRARAMRHAVPAAMNERGATVRQMGGRRVSTDWAVPFRALADAIACARDIAGRHGVPPAVTYGHAGSGHPHQNYLARDASEVAVMERVVEETLRQVVAMGGTIAAEHGIGKLKRRWLPLQMSSLQLGVMRSVKRELDPAGMLAPGNIF
jgi:FAD/FMN-containing dehydrogenase